MIKCKEVLIALTTASFIAGLAISSPAMAAEKSKVLIGFKQMPGVAEEAMVRRFGGKIKYAYHIIPAIAAAVPDVAIPGLRANPNVTHVHIDGKVWALDAELDNSWGVKQIGAGLVHESNKGTGIKLVIMDTGIDPSHPDLDANYQGGYDFVNTDNNPMDDHGHGTHCAGIAAAEDNDAGVVGVAPEAHIYALKVLGADGSGHWSDVIAALQWSIAHGMQVVNMSFGGTAPSDVEIACQAAYDAGILLVAAAGNSGNPPGKGDNISDPGRYASVIAVGATDQSDGRARWSSTGPDLELSAPGVNVNSTLPGGGYGKKSGTSMASPHVAGTAALVWVAYPAWTNADIRYQLQITADDLGDAGWDAKYGYGLVDADGAVSPPPPPPGDTMYAESITFSSDKKGKNIFLYTTVKVVDDNGLGVEGANVSMTETWSNEGSSKIKDFSGVTDAIGEVVFKWPKAQPGNYTTTVTALTHTDYTWDDTESVTSASCVLNADGSFQGMGSLSGVELTSTEMKRIALASISPNPFSEKTEIRYTIPDAGCESRDLSLKIYDASGKVVRDLSNHLALCIRNHASVVTWDGADETGKRVTPGIYFCRLEGKGYSATEKLTLIR